MDLQIRFCGRKPRRRKGDGNPEAQAWYIQYGKIKGTDLEKLIIVMVS